MVKKNYLKSRGVLKEEEKNKYKNLPEEEKKKCQRNYYDSKKIKKWNINFLYTIKMSKKTLKFDNIEVNKKEFHTSK